MEKFTERAIALMKQIPKGKVMTYGQIARVAGSPRGARQVVRILHSMSQKYELPWHRVVNRNGEISLRDEELANIQKWTLESEGVVFKGNYQLDLAVYQWRSD